MNNKINIRNALISVFDKEGLEDIVYKLNASGVNIYSTGGTENFIKNLGVNVEKIENLKAELKDRNAIISYLKVNLKAEKTLHDNTRDYANKTKRVLETKVKLANSVIRVYQALLFIAASACTYAFWLLS